MGQAAISEAGGSASALRASGDGPATSPPTHGTRPPVFVLALAATGLSGAMWQRLARMLAPGSVVVAPDLLGYGESQPWDPAQVFRFEDDLALVDAVFDAVDRAEIVLPRPQPPQPLVVHLVGHSYGGRLAVRWLDARARPAAPAEPIQVAMSRPVDAHTPAGTRVRACSLSLFEPVLMGFVAADTCASGVPMDAALRSDLAAHFFASGRRGTEDWVREFVDYWNGEGTWDAGDAEERARFLRSSAKMFDEVQTTWADRWSRADAMRLTLPALVLWGEASTQAARSIAHALVEALPNAAGRALAGGHMAPVESSREVARAIAAHIHQAHAARPHTRPLARDPQDRSRPDRPV